MSNNLEGIEPQEQSHNTDGSKPMASCIELMKEVIVNNCVMDSTFCESFLTNNPEYKRLVKPRQRWASWEGSRLGLGYLIFGNMIIFLKRFREYNYYTCSLL
jgi:hypothetical protein